MRTGLPSQPYAHSLWGTRQMLSPEEQTVNLGNVCKTAMAASVLACAAMAQNVVTDWNQIALQTIVLNAGKSGFDAPAYFAYTGVAMFDAANSIDHRFKSFAVSVEAPAGASVDAAVVTAAHDVLAHYFSLQQASLDAA